MDSVKNNTRGYERNHIPPIAGQGGHRGKISSLCFPKEFPLKNITEKIIACALCG